MPDEQKKEKYPVTPHQSLPTLEREIGGTLYTVTGSFDSCAREDLVRKVKRLMLDDKETV